MTDEQALYLTLLALYLLECAVWVPRGSAALISKASGEAKLRFPRQGVSNNRGGLVLGPLVPGSGAVFVVPQWPVSIGPEGALAWVAESLELEQRAHQNGLLARFDDTQPAKADARDVMVGDAVLATTASAGLARRVAEAIEKVRGAPGKKRKAVLDSILTEHVDVEIARRRAEEVWSATRALRWASLALAGIVFAGAPAAVMGFGLEVVWLPVLIAVYAATWTCAALFFRAHKKVSPGARLERIGQTILFAIYPIGAIRATDAIGRSALHGVHPLAAAVALAPPEQQRDLAAHLLRDARFPRRPVCLNEDPAAEAIEAFFREALLRHLTKLAEKAGVSSDQVTAPPAPEEGCSTYCPRCHAQFEKDTEACADCGGVPVLPLPAAKTAGAPAPETA
jgi:hypothetical protein